MSPRLSSAPDATPDYLQSCALEAHAACTGHEGAVEFDSKQGQTCGTSMTWNGGLIIYQLALITCLCGWSGDYPQKSREAAAVHFITNHSVQHHAAHGMTGRLLQGPVSTLLGSSNALRHMK
jgi:hypothetical protein